MRPVTLWNLAWGGSWSGSVASLDPSRSRSQRKRETADTGARSDPGARSGRSREAD